MGVLAEFYQQVSHFRVKSFVQRRKHRYKVRTVVQGMVKVKQFKKNFVVMGEHTNIFTLKAPIIWVPLQLR